MEPASVVGRALLTLAMAACALRPCTGLPVATNDRMRKVVCSFVGRTGNSVIGLGSWISGKLYSDPLQSGSSDHDLRLLLPRGTSPAQARTEYNLARQQLVALIRQEFGADAARVLRTVNLYPPTQLMRGVETAEDAVETFAKLGMAPNLAHEGRVTAENAGRVAEGLYGESASAWTQQYERDAGRLFYQENGYVQTGMTDLAHLGEGEARYTLAGMANTASQWADHLDDALNAGDPKKVAKYLARLDRDLAKARSLGRCAASPALREEIQLLTAQMQLKPSAARMEALAGQVAAITRRARAECAILARIDRAGTMQKELLRALMGGSGVADDLARAFNKAVDAAGNLPWEKGLNTLLAAVAAWQISGKGGEEGVLAAMKEGMPWMVGLAPGICMALTDALLEWSKEAGYAYMASTQDAWDLMAGIYSAVGRADVEDRAGAWSLAMLVEKVHDPNQLARLVMGRATIASARGFGDMRSSTGKADARVAEAIFSRCYPVILAAWRARREALFLEYSDICEAILRRPLVMVAAPSSATWTAATRQVVVSCAALTKGGPLDAQVARARAIIQTLSGLKPSHSISYNWAPRGVAQELAYQRKVALLKPGRHLISATRVVEFTAFGLPTPNNIDQALQVAASVEVELKPEPRKPAVAGARPPVPPTPGGTRPPQAPRDRSGEAGTGADAAQPPANTGARWVLDRVEKKEFDLLGHGVAANITDTYAEATLKDPPNHLKDRPTRRIHLSLPPQSARPGETITLTFSGDESQLKSPTTTLLPRGWDKDWSRTVKFRFPSLGEANSESAKKLVITYEFDLWNHDYWRQYFYVLK